MAETSEARFPSALAMFVLPAPVTQARRWEEVVASFIHAAIVALAFLVAPRFWYRFTSTSETWFASFPRERARAFLAVSPRHRAISVALVPAASDWG